MTDMSRIAQMLFWVKGKKMNNEQHYTGQNGLIEIVFSSSQSKDFCEVFRTDLLD